MKGNQNKPALSVTNKEIWQISYPIIFGNLAQTIMVFVNTVFIGHVGNIELGAVMLAGIYYLVFTALAMGFAIGVQIIIARRFGEQNYKQIGVVFEHGLLFTTILGITLWVIMHFFSDILLDLIIDSPNVYEAALQFTNYRHYGIVIVCINYLFRSLYIGLSNTKIITYTTILMAAVNIFLDYSLIFGNLGFPEMGIRGAGLSSVCAELSALLLFLFHTLKMIPFRKYALFEFGKIEPPLLKSVLKLAFPTMLQRLMSFGLWFVFFAMIEHTGEMPIAVSGIVRSVYMLVTIPVFAFSATSNTLTSRLIGAGKQEEIPRTLVKIVKMSIATIIPLVVICVCAPQYIARIYTDDLILAANSASTIYVILAATLVLAPAMIYFEFISGTGHTLSALLLEACVLVLYVVYLYLSSSIWNLSIEWIWCTEVLYGTLLLVTSVSYMKIAKWRK
ncbi:MAG: MATE family efflux transporter [Bacteroidales bacterium]|nr:MATE family efflux transporter [Bacteroidales bacterium]